MTDLIDKSHSDFMRYKSQCNVNDFVQLKEKYDNLFKKYDCFQNSIKMKDHVKVSHHNKPKTRCFYDDRKTVKPLNRTILSILNIINASNYMKNLNKLRIVASQDNISTIVKEILFKASREALYMKVFIKLIIDMIKLSGYADQIHKEITTFAESFTEKKEYQFNESQDMTVYDRFCKEQKHKKIAITKNILIMELIRGGALNICVNDYFKHFVQEMLDYSLNQAVDVDLLLQITIDIIKILGNRINKKLIHNSHDAIYKNTMPNMKTKFMKDELLNIMGNIE